MKRMLFVIPVVIAVTLLFSCKKDAAPAFTWEGRWTVSFAYTSGVSVSGSFLATLKSNGQWDYLETGPGNNVANVGPWSVTGDSIQFKFNSSGDALYKGKKTSNTSMQGTMLANSGTASGSWSAIKE
jgi:hypothetical protein